MRNDDVNIAAYNVTKYYYLGGQRVAMRHCAGITCDAPLYLHADHLGSASLATNDAGGVVSEMRYYPYGETRWESEALPTDRRYTGQRYEAGTGLYDYNARYYDPCTNICIQPDSIVPDFTNPQSLNRYMYVLGNPLKYTDPTGHVEEDEVNDAEKIHQQLLAYGVHIVEDWFWEGLFNDN